MAFDFKLIADSIPRIAEGLELTLQLLLLSSFFGFLLAIVLLLMKISGRKALSVPAHAYTFVFRGTPVLVQLFVIYHGLPQFEFIREGFLWPVFKDPFWCTIVALSLNSGAYVSEIMRGGVLGVDKGLLEAASALGIGRAKRFLHITSPIAVRLSIPAYSNDFISMLKATALASTVTLLDMTGVARTIVAETYKPYEIFISAAVIYVVMAWLLQNAFRLLETKMSRSLKK